MHEKIVTRSDERWIGGCKSGLVMATQPALASENPKSNRCWPVITAELIAEIKRLAELGKSANEITDSVNWP